MSDYFTGIDVAGAQWGEPVTIEDPSWGVPTEIVDEDWGKPFLVEGDDIALRSMFDVLRQVDLNRDSIIGLIDINQAQRQMDELTPVTVGVANSLMRGGMLAINGAIAGAERPSVTKAMFGMSTTLPGDTDRKNVLGKLKWHQDNIAGLKDQNALYPNFLDLKKWTMQAYIEGNAVETGAAYLDTAWSQMWAEIRAALAAIPAQVTKVLADQASAIVKAATGLPIWAWVAIAGGVLLLISGVVVLVARSHTGAVVAKHFIGR